MLVAKGMLYTFLHLPYCTFPSFYFWNHFFLCLKRKYDMTSFQCLCLSRSLFSRYRVYFYSFPRSLPRAMLRPGWLMSWRVTGQWCLKRARSRLLSPHFLNVGLEIDQQSHNISVGSCHVNTAPTGRTGFFYVDGKKTTLLYLLYFVCVLCFYFLTFPVEDKSWDKIYFGTCRRSCMLTLDVEVVIEKR